MASDNLKSLYNTLKNSGYNPPSYEQFVKDMADDNNLRKVHNTLIKEGYTPPTFDKFKLDMGFVTQSETKPQTTESAVKSVTDNTAASPTVTQPQQQVTSQQSVTQTAQRPAVGSKPAWQVMEAFNNQVQQGQSRLKGTIDNARQNATNIRKGNKSGSFMGERELNPQTGKVEKKLLHQARSASKHSYGTEPREHRISHMVGE